MAKKKPGRKPGSTREDYEKNPMTRFNLACPRKLWKTFVSLLDRTNKTLNECIVDIIQEYVRQYEHMGQSKPPLLQMGEGDTSPKG